MVKSTNLVINEQTKIRPCRVELLFKINKRACTSILYTRVPPLGFQKCFEAFNLSNIKTLIQNIEIVVAKFDFRKKLTPLYSLKQAVFSSSFGSYNKISFPSS